MFLNRFHANQTYRKIQTNHSTQIKHNHLITRPRLSSCVLIPQQMPTSVPLSENFISNYTVKKLHSAVLNIKNSRNALRKKKEVWHWSNKTYFKQPLHQKGYFKNWHEIKYANWIEAKTILGWDTARLQLPNMIWIPITESFTASFQCYRLK